MRNFKTRELGATVSFFPWIDDFSAARNESIRRAKGQWVFWMDSDDTIDAENGKKLREVAEREHQPNVLGYVMQVHCPGPDPADTTDITVVDHVKLFRNHRFVRFEGRIHEQVLMPIRRLGGEFEWTDVFVTHSAADHSPASKQRKYERDLRILYKDVAERPGHPFVLFNLGMTFNDMQRHAEAVEWLQRCIGLSNAGESHLPKAFAILAHSLFDLGRYEDSLGACYQAKAIFPNDPELLFREGLALHQTGRLWDAARAYQAILDSNVETNSFKSVRRGILGPLTRHNLAVVYRDLGRLDLAECQWRAILSQSPEYRPAKLGLDGILAAT